LDSLPGSIVTTSQLEQSGDRAAEPEASSITASNPSAVHTDAATRERALLLVTEAQATGRKLTGAELGRAIGRSDRYGRLLLREFRTTSGTGGNGEPPR
jgi:hypothetical protein